MSMKTWKTSGTEDDDRRLTLAQGGTEVGEGNEAKVLLASHDHVSGRFDPGVRLEVGFLVAGDADPQERR